MTSTLTPPSAPTTSPEAPDARPVFGLTLAQVAGSSLAAVSSALAASFLGVAGTIAGALLGSLVGTVGTAVYSHSFTSAGMRLRALRPDGSPVDEAESTTGRDWRRPVVGVAAGAVLALAGITAAETWLGHPISSSSENGTTIGRAVKAQSGTTNKTSVTKEASTDTAVSEPTASPTTAAPTSPTSSPTATASPTTGTTASPTTAAPSPTATTSAPAATPTTTGPTP